VKSSNFRPSAACLAAFLIVIFTFPAAARSTVSPETWHILETGNIAYGNGEFGEALKLCESARESHSAEIERYRDVIRIAMESREVRKAGDDIGAIRDVLVKRDESDPVAIIDMVLGYHPADYFGNSMKRLLSWLEDNKAYPEADILSGKVFESEGEPKVALSWYRKAWVNKEYLDIPDEKYQLSYRMADMSFAGGDFGSQEKYLLSILEEDTVFGKPGAESPTLQAMMRTLETEQTVDKFFLLYRHANYTGLKAYIDLASFYYGNGSRLDRAFPVAVLAACVSVSRLSEAVTQSDFTWSYSGLPELMVRVGKNPEIAKWAKENHVWTSFSLLASIMRDRGLHAQSESLWEMLASSCPDAKVARRAGAEIGTVRAVRKP
jgi:tetratricopeptide (TPR) repeat protein